MTHLGELLSAYLDGELTTAEQERVVAHLTDCEACVSELGELHEARATLRSLPTLEVPSHLLPGEEPLAEVIPLRRRPQVWAAAAAAALVILIGIATAFAPTPMGVEVPIEDLSNQYRARNSLEPSFSPIEVVPVILERAE